MSRMWIKCPSGLHYYDYRHSDGAVAQVGQVVTVHYVMSKYRDGLREDLRSGHEGWLDNSWAREEPVTFRIGAKEVLLGIDEGIVGMRIAGYRHMRIPANLAFGEKGIPDVIAPNSELYCELYLVEISE